MTALVYTVVIDLISMLCLSAHLEVQAIQLHDNEFDSARLLV